MLRQANAVGFVRRQNGYLLTEMFSPSVFPVLLAAVSANVCNNLEAKLKGTNKDCGVTDESTHYINQSTLQLRFMVITAL